MIVEQAQTKPDRPFLAGIWLILALPITAVLALGMGQIFGMGIEAEIGDLELLLVFGVGQFVAGYLWARSLLGRVGLPKSQMAHVAAGFGFAVPIVIPELSGTFDVLIDGAGIRGNVPLEFAVFFIPWNAVVTGFTGFALGLGLKDWKLALKLLLIGLLTGAIIFSLTIFVMGLFGFEVGTRRADEIPSMPVITLPGIWITALVGTHFFGRILKNTKFAFGD